MLSLAYKSSVRFRCYNCFHGGNRRREVLQKYAPYRWQSILRQHSGSGRLWRAYTSWQRTRFASFTISSMQQAHRQALAVCLQPTVDKTAQIRVSLADYGALIDQEGPSARCSGPAEFLSSHWQDPLCMCSHDYSSRSCQSAHSLQAILS